MSTIVKFRDWTFEVDKEENEKTYQDVSRSGAENCGCNGCENYITYRDNVFPKEIIDLFGNLGVDYRKEVEVTDWETLPNGFHHIGGWFHFKGRVVTGKIYLVPVPSGGHTFDLTPITENFSIGFGAGNNLTFFKSESDLVQVEFETNIPWIIDKTPETV